MLEGGSGRTELRRTARGIERALESLDDMLEVLILLARVESGLQIVELRACQLADDLGPALREVSDIAARRGIPLRLRRLHGVAWSNPKLLATAIKSLLLNAIKFGDGGGIHVGCRRSRDRLRLEVQFGGAPLDAAIERHAFVQLSAKGDCPTPGELGLGFALLRRLCRCLGHELQHVVSEPDRQLLALTLPLLGASGRAVPISG
jgi:two-component system, sensor histidine kinase